MIVLYNLAIVAVALAAAPQDAGPQEDTDLTYLGFQEQEGPLTMGLSKKAIAVRFMDGVKLERQQEIVKSDVSLDPDAQWSDLGLKGVHVVALKESLSTDDVLGVMRQLEALPDVEYAAPVIEFKRYLSAVTNRFYLDFTEPAPERELAELNENHGVVIDRVLRYPKINCVAYWLRVSKASDGNAAELATLYTQTLVPRNSGPCAIYLSDALASTPNDYRYNLADPDADQYYLHSDAELGINMPDVWSSIKGNPNITVAVIDNGVDLYYQGFNGQGHADLGTGSNGSLSSPSNQWVNSDENFTTGSDNDGNGYNNDRYGWNFTPNPEGECCTEGKVPEGPSYFPHGTWVSGVIAAISNNSTGVAGIAGGWNGNPQGCKIMPIRALPNVCYCAIEDVVDAINYAVDNGAHVINMSLGAYTPPNGLALAINNARASDCLPVAASCNHDEYNNFPYPAILDNVLTVGALNRCADDQNRKWGSNTGAEGSDDDCNPHDQGGPCPPESSSCDCTSIGSWGSNHGNKLDLCATGIKLWTTGKESYADDYSNTLSKTSSATPQVAGAAALLFANSLDANNQPRLSANQVQAILEFSATDLDYTRTYNGGTETEDAGPGRDEYTGYGRLNAAAALELANAPRFVINNEENKHCASFDSQGNLVVEGGLTQVAGTANLNPTSDNEFIVRDSSYDEIVRVNSPSSHYAAEMFIKGKLYERVNISLDNGMPARSFRIKNGDGDTVALINSQSFTNSTLEPTSPNTVPAGSVILTGRCFIGGSPDRLSSQGK